MDSNRLHELEEKWLAENLNQEEKEELDNWYNFPLNEIYIKKERIYSEENHQKILFKRIENEIGKPQSKYYNFKRVLAVAAILILVIVSIFIVNNRNTITVPMAYKNTDLLPGKISATITFANGKNIILNSKEGSNLSNYSINISRIIPSNNSYVYNKISTRKGEKFSFTLSDGTKVWLNSISSIRFPTIFHGRERKVMIQGEAYFEVSKDASHPFVVVTDKENEVKVLGTHFNVNTYWDNLSEKVTLLEGSVQFQNKHERNNYINLNPGEQAIEINGSLYKKNVYGEDFIDWKNDQFVFDGEALELIMRRLSRWYAFDFSFENKSDRTILFTGIISGRKSLRQVLNIFTLTNKSLEFSLKGNQLVIKNKNSN